MKRVALLGLLLAGCATALPSGIDVQQRRPLSAPEKTALTKALARDLKDPEAARFRWLPAILPPITSTEPIGYCGMVNGKNSFGGYIGFRSFFALLDHDGKGNYTGGSLRTMSGRPTTFFGNDNVDDAVANGLVEGSCKRWGYVDFASAAE